MSYDPRAGYGHMEQWRSSRTEEWVGSFEIVDYPYQDKVICPKCGGDVTWWEGQTGEEWDGSAIYEGCNVCDRCNIHDQWWSVDG